MPWTLAVDLLLLLPWRSQLQPAAEAEARGRDVPGTGPVPSWQRPLQRWLRGQTWWRAITGYRRLAALPPAPYPLQFALDRVVIPAWLGEGREATRRLIRALPSIGDAILEGAMLQAFLASFFASACSSCSRRHFQTLPRHFLNTS